MLRLIPQLTLFLALYLTTAAVGAQESDDHRAWAAYYGVDIEYFFPAAAIAGGSDHFRALRHELAGQPDSAIYYLERILRAPREPDTLRENARELLYAKYLERRRYAAARALDGSRDLDFLRRAPAPRVSATDSTVVRLDRYYLDAVLGNDSVRIFLDTGAPGLTVDARWIAKYGWPLDTASAGKIVEPYLGIEYPVHAARIARLRIGSFTFSDLPARAMVLTEEQWSKKTSSGIERYDIIMGLDVFYGLIDGIEFDFPCDSLRLYATLPPTDAAPNFQRVEGKPAISFRSGGRRYPAFMDTGSPRHVLTKEIVAQSDTLGSFNARYGSYEYRVYKLRMEALLNLHAPVMEAADYARRASSGKFAISAHFGVFPDYRLRYHLSARRVELLR